MDTIETMRAVATFMLLPAFLTGCTGLEPAVIGAAASATSAGAVVFSQGRISAAAIADYDRVREGVLRSADDLSLSPVYEREGPIWSKYTLEDDLGKDITIRVRRRTSTMTQVDIDVGRFGNEAIGRLFLLRMTENVPQSGLRNLLGTGSQGGESPFAVDPD